MSGDFNFRIVALDPGKTTGWDTYSAMEIYNVDGAPEFYNEKWTGGYLGGDSYHFKLEQLLGLQRVQKTILVVERFDQRINDRAADLTAKEYIGVATKWAQQNDVPVVLQMPAHAKGFVKDANLKKVDLWIPGHVNRHQRDARRHILYYMINQLKRNDLLEKGWK